MNITVYRLTKPATIGERALKPDLSASFTYVAVPAKNIPIALRMSLLLFTFTFPFGAMDLGFMSGSLSMPKLSGFLFFAFYFLYYGPFSSKRTFPRPSRAMWWFLGYVAVFVANGLFVGEEFVGAFFTLGFTLVQLAVFFWIASDLLKDEKLARSVLLGYSIASALLAVGIILQVPGFYEQEQGRATAFGDDPNEVAGYMAISAVTTIGLYLYGSYRHFLSKILVLVLTLALLVVMVKTGSRGVAAGFMIGGLVYLLPYWRSKRTLTAIILASSAMFAVASMIASNPEVLERWRHSYYEGSSSGRDEILAVTAEMISERPIFGWQPVNFNYEIGRRLGGDWASRARDVHNLFLSVLAEVGVLGAIPFFVGLWLCVRSAWRARSGNLGLLPMALVITALVIGMSYTYLTSKTTWLIWALAVAAASGARTELQNRVAPQSGTGKAKTGPLTNAPGGVLL
jgi:O-antigen ligase